MSSSGDAATNDRRTNATSSTATAASSTSVRAEAHPHRLPCDSTSIARPKAGGASNRPTRSVRCGESIGGGSGNRRMPITATTSAAGASTANSHRQLMPTSHDPSTGVSQPATEPTRPQTPTTCAARAEGNSGSTSASAPAANSAAPAPCTTRAPSSHHSPGATAAMAAPTPYAARPRTK